MLLRRLFTRFLRRAFGLGMFQLLLGQLLHDAVEIARRLFRFQLPAFLLVQGVLGMSMFLGQFVGNLARVQEYFTVAESQEIVQLGNPIGHMHWAMAAGLKFGEIEIGGNNQVQRLDFRLRQIVFCDGHIGFANGARWGVFPRGQTHVWLRCVGAVLDDLCSRVTMGGPVNLVLNDPKELPRHFGISVVIDARAVNVGDLLIKEPLAGANIADPGKQFVEVVGAKCAQP